MKLYGIYLKSHFDYPDFEAEVEADNAWEALQTIQKLQPELDEEYLKQNMAVFNNKGGIEEIDWGK